MARTIVLLVDVVWLGSVGSNAYLFVIVSSNLIGWMTLRLERVNLFLFLEFDVNLYAAQEKEYYVLGDKGTNVQLIQK